MKTYTFARDLDGAPAGSTATLTPEEAAPLLRSGAIVASTPPVGSDAIPNIVPVNAAVPETHAKHDASPSVTVTPRRKSKDRPADADVV